MRLRTAFRCTLALACEPEHKNTHALDNDIPGVAYTAACGGTKGAGADSTASAGDSGTSVAPLPAGGGAGRAVLELNFQPMELSALL